MWKWFRDNKGIVLEVAESKSRLCLIPVNLTEMEQFYKEELSKTAASRC